MDNFHQSKESKASPVLKIKILRIRIPITIYTTSRHIDKQNQAIPLCKSSL